MLGVGVEYERLGWRREGLFVIARELQPIGDHDSDKPAAPPPAADCEAQKSSFAAFDEPARETGNRDIGRKRLDSAVISAGFETRFGS